MPASLLALLILCAETTWSQKTVVVRGKVFSKQVVDHTGHDHSSEEGRAEENWEALPGAYVVWKSTGQGTATDAHGFFRLEGAEGDTLVASFIGLESAELPFIGQDFVEIPLGQGFQLNEAEVVAKGPTTSVSLLDPLVVQSLGRDELCRAACCNLSEAFETNAAVDASFTDAVTGTKQIRMLGLDGKYTQIMFDNMPGARG
ncbi:MAG: carboxypeptidase-like regulatory domain-containing protein, partial [Flavobacteriales bacterium]|nr:carboxypeptidase-like regulatory domain-containing protein [Flavobacteriales bacterium]